MGEIVKSKYFRIFTVLLLLQAALFYTASHGDARRLDKPLSLFPTTLSGWQLVREGIVEKEELDVLKANDVVSRFYARGALLNAAETTPGRKEMIIATAPGLFIAYFETQQQGQSPHSPKNCLPGSGWQMLETGEIDIPLPAQNAIKVNKYVVQKSEYQDLVLYWYQSHGRVVANEYSAKFYLVADSLRYHRSDTALVRIMVPVIQDDVAAALDTGVAFAQAVFPAVYKYLPR